MLAGGTVEVAYGVGALLAPARMVSTGYAPDTHGEADPRLLLRAFGGHLLVAGCLTLAATRSPHHARSAITLSLLINALDVISTVLERCARGQRDRTFTRGIALSGTGTAVFAAALHALPR
jgi:hypothetical protein